MRPPAVVREELGAASARAKEIRERLPDREAEVDELLARVAELRAAGEPDAEAAEELTAAGLRLEADRRALDDLEEARRELEVELARAAAEAAAERLDRAEEEAGVAARALVEWLDGAPALFERVTGAREASEAAVEAERRARKADAARVRAVERSGGYTASAHTRTDGRSRAAIASDRVCLGLRVLVDVLHAYGAGNTERLQLYETLLHQLATGQLRRK